MISTLFTVALFIAPAIQGVFADFAINSPNLVQCQSSNISWEPTKGPYNLIVVKASDPCGDALVDLGDFNKTFIQWTTILPAGTQVQLSLVDVNDQEAWSNTITVGPSDNTSCLPGSTGSSSGSGSNSGSNSGSGSKSGSSSSSSPSSTPTDVTPLGAANAGTNPFNSGAISARRASTPLLAIIGLAAAFALSL